MPLFVFRCSRCGKQVEGLFKADEKGPKCCGKPMEKQVSTFGFVLNGAGFHKNDYPKVS